MNESYEPSTDAEKLEYVLKSRHRVTVDPYEVTIAFEDEEPYHSLYPEILDHIQESVNLKLKDRYKEMLLLRLGINEKAKTLEEIGKVYSLTRERVRQLLKKSIRWMAIRSTKTSELLDLEYRRVMLGAKIEALSAAKFFSFLLLNGISFNLVKFISVHYLYSEVSASIFEATLKQADCEKKRKLKIEVEALKSLNYNDKIYRLITYPRGKRSISDEDFSRLEKKADLSATDEYDDETATSPYEDQSQAESRLMKNFAKNGTFKRVTRRSLAVPLCNSFCLPNLQCLTHENTFVIIDVKSLFTMCRHRSIERFDAIREYCKKYGFGYIIMDDRGNSYEHIDDESPAFSEAILSELNTHRKVTYDKYVEICKSTGATQKNLLTLIKKHELRLLSPFLLLKRKTDVSDL